MSRFDLHVEGEQYGGWQSIRVTRGLERATADFHLSVSERWPRMESPEPWQIPPGAECVITIDDETLLTGWVDSYKPSFDATSHAVEVSGRSKTCDFVDSSVTLEGGQMKGLTVLEIARKLAEPFGIEVVATVTSGQADEDDIELEPEPDVQCQPSETCFDLVERLARLQELLITDDPDGRLVLTRAGALRATDALIQGKNVKSAQGNLDESKRFSDYIVKAQRPGNRTHDKKWAQDPLGDVIPRLEDRHATADEARAAWRAGRLRLLRARAERDAQRAARQAADDGDEEDGGGFGGDGSGGGTDTDSDRGADVINQIVGTAKDPEITRFRPHVIVAEQQTDDNKAEQRADWEMRRRAAKGIGATVVVNNWHQGDGALWQPNMMVRTTIPWLAIDHELVISEVEYAYGEEGELVTLTLTLPDAFLPEKFRKTRRGKKARKGGAAGKIDYLADVKL